MKGLDMRPLMRQDFPAILLIIRTAHHDGAHPAKGDDRPIGQPQTDAFHPFPCPCFHDSQ